MCFSWTNNCALCRANSLRMLGGSVPFLSQIFIFFLFSCDEFKKFFLNENETSMVLDSVCGRHCSI